MCSGCVAVGCRRQEHAELVDLEQDRRLPVHRGQEAGPEAILLPPRSAEACFNEQLGDDLAAVVLAGTRIGDADDVEVGAKVALGPVLAAHQRTESARAGTHRQHWLRPAGGRQHVVDQAL